MDQMADWVGWGAIVAVKVGLNFAVPGLAAVVDFGQACRDLYKGDIAGFVVNATSGVVEVVTCGFVGSAKEAMKGSAKAATVSSAKEAAKQATGKKATKEIAQQLSTFIAKGGIDEAVEEVFRQHTKTTLASFGHQGLKGFISSGGHDISTNVLESFCEQSLKGVFELTSQNKPINQFQLNADAAKTGAEKEFMENQYLKLLKIEYGLATVKGGIRAGSQYFTQNDSGAISEREG